MTSEAQIRDALAERLELIEDGLTLIQKEFHLPNAVGTKGYIDILAKDKFNQLVIIEIKKSNRTAREAIHELFKYVGLLKANHKLSNDRVRCILLSTEWRELLVPFSEFARDAHYHVEGYQILLEQYGLPASFKLVELVPEGENLSFCPHHMIYLYSTEARRADALPKLEATLKSLNLQFLIISLNYNGDNPEVIYPFAHYLVITAISPEIYNKLEEEYSLKVEIDPDEPREPNEWEFEDEVLGFIGKSTFSLHDDTEIGYPEKFVGILKSWKIVDISRHGKGLGSSQIYSDDFMIAQIMGLEGENAAVYHVISSPRFRDKWVKAKEGASYSLLGNDNWESGFDAYLDEVGTKDRTATVSIFVYNPCNTILSLYKLAKGESQYLPVLEVAVEESKGYRVKILWGCLIWDGLTYPQSPERVIRDVFDDQNLFFMAMHFGETYIYEERVARRHGFTYDLFEFIIEGGKPLSMKRVQIKEDKVIREPLTNIPYDVLKFTEENKTYLRSLVTYIASGSSGF
jgi:hypothetical protein